MTKTKDVSKDEARIASARAWIDRELSGVQARPIDALGQGRVGRLQRHLARLDSMGEAYLPTIEQEMPDAASYGPADQ